LKYVLRYALIIVYTIFWGTLGVVIGLVDRSGRGVIWVGRNWVSWIMKSCGIRVTVEGLENVDPRRPQVFMSNHQSAFDIGAIVTTVPVDFRFIAKRELTYIPFFGWAMALGGHVIVDRGKRSKAIASLDRAARQIARGTNVIIFPEGTRSPTGELRAFKKGGFHLALAAQVPIVPVTVSGSTRITPKRSLRVESGEIKIVYGKPIPTGGMSADDRFALVDMVREAITAGYDPSYQESAA
jgi:1-acyl-sn-glycerol-3-phosphate acyltransferase